MSEKCLILNITYLQGLFEKQEASKHKHDKTRNSKNKNMPFLKVAERNRDQNFLVLPERKFVIKLATVLLLNEIGFIQL